MILTEYTYPTSIRIALLSDLHNKKYNEITKTVRQIKPEIICITGDVIYGHCEESDEPIVTKQKNVIPFLRECADIAPSFFSLGNHEASLTDVDIDLIKKTGVRVLNNEYTVYNNVIIGGLTSASCTDNVLNDDWLDDFEKQVGFKILLCHHPEYRDRELAERKIDLILCGHCHGGQIRLFDHGLFAPGQGWLPKYTKGIYGNMIVSAGLSNTGGVIPRLFNPREIVYITK